MTVSGVTSTDGLDINGATVTVAESSLNKSATVTISEGYELTLAKNVPRAETRSGWAFSGTSAIYSSKSTTEGYKLEDNAINYVEASADEILLELRGVDKDNAPVVDDKKVTFTEISFADDDENISVVSNEGGYEFEVSASNYAGVTFSGKVLKDRVTNVGTDLIINLGKDGDSIRNEGTNVTIDGGEGIDRISNFGKSVEIIGGKGNDIVSVSSGDSGNIFIYNKGDGRDNLFNFGALDTIKIADDLPIEAAIKGNDVVFNVGTGSITVKNNVTANRRILVVDKNNKAIESVSDNIYVTAGVINDDTITLAADFAEKIYTVANVNKVDATQLQTGISIEAGVEDVTMLGGTSRDTLISGTANNFEFTGGKGNDVFAKAAMVLSKIIVRRVLMAKISLSYRKSLNLRNTISQVTMSF